MGKETRLFPAAQRERESERQRDDLRGFSRSSLGGKIYWSLNHSRTLGQLGAGAADEALASLTSVLTESNARHLWHVRLLTPRNMFLTLRQYCTDTPAKELCDCVGTQAVERVFQK